MLRFCSGPPEAENASGVDLMSSHKQAKKYFQDKKCVQNSRRERCKPVIGGDESESRKKNVKKNLYLWQCANNEKTWRRLASSSILT